jgi:anti-sigma regulatory factor (Ser/Thr protein kinase)
MGRGLLRRRRSRQRPRLKLALVLEEAAMNVLSHAFADRPPPHAIRIRLDVGLAEIVAEIVDNGRPFDPSAAPPPDFSIPLAARDPGGLGIHLIRTMMDKVEYRRAGAENILRLAKARP